MTYTAARRYANRLLPDQARDVLHDAWLYYYNKTGNNLLDEDNGYVCRAIKWRVRTLQRPYFQHRGNIYGITYTDTNELVGDFDPSTILDNEDAAIETRQFYTNLYNTIENYVAPANAKKGTTRLTIEQLKILVDLLDKGYSQADIAEYLNTSRQNITNLNKKLKKLVRKMVLTNPFNGSKIAIKKTLTETQWEKRTDLDDFELEDYNEFYKIFIHKESKEGWLVKLTEQKINPYLKKLYDASI